MIEISHLTKRYGEHPAAFDSPENLEQHLLSHNEVVLTSDAGEDEVRTLLGSIDHITDLTLEAAEGGLVTARVKTDLSSAFDLSRRIFSAFAAGGAVLLELTVKKANLEDIFLELAEDDSPPVVEADLVDSEVTEE